MPQQDQSSKCGSSPSPVINRVIDNCKGVQTPLPVNTATNSAHNKKPVPVK
jgi:hypothetical protein